MLQSPSAAKDIVKVFRDHSAISSTELDTIEQNVSSHPASFIKGLLILDLIDEEGAASFIVQTTGYPRAPRDLYKHASQEALNQLDRALIARLEVVPLFIQENTLVVAMADPCDQYILAQLKFFTQMKVRPMVANLIEIYSTLHKILGKFEPVLTPFEKFVRDNAMLMGRVDSKPVSVDLDLNFDLDAERSDSGDYEDLSLVDEQLSSLDLENITPEAAPDFSAMLEGGEQLSSLDSKSTNTENENKPDDILSLEALPSLDGDEIKVEADIVVEAEQEEDLTQIDIVAGEPENEPSLDLEVASQESSQSVAEEPLVEASTPSTVLFSGAKFISNVNSAAMQMVVVRDREKLGELLQKFLGEFVSHIASWRIDAAADLSPKFNWGREDLTQSRDLWLGTEEFNLEALAALNLLTFSSLNIANLKENELAMVNKLEQGVETVFVLVVARQEVWMNEPAKSALTRMLRSLAKR